MLQTASVSFLSRLSPLLFAPSLSPSLRTLPCRLAKSLGRAAVISCRAALTCPDQWQNKGPHTTISYLNTKVPPAPRPSTSLGLKEIFPTTRVSASAPVVGKTEPKGGSARMPRVTERGGIQKPITPHSQRRQSPSLLAPTLDSAFHKRDWSREAIG